MQPRTLETLDQSHVGEVSLLAAVSISELANTLLATAAHRMLSSFYNVVSLQICNKNSSRSALKKTAVTSGKCKAAVSTRPTSRLVHHRIKKCSTFIKCFVCVCACERVAQSQMIHKDKGTSDNYSALRLMRWCSFLNYFQRAAVICLPHGAARRRWLWLMWHIRRRGTLFHCNFFF